MRKLVQPPPSIPLRSAATANCCSNRLSQTIRSFDMEVEKFVCAKCAHAQLFRVIHDPLCRTRREEYAARRDGRVGRVQQQVMRQAECFGAFVPLRLSQPIVE